MFDRKDVGSRTGIGRCRPHYSADGGGGFGDSLDRDTAAIQKEMENDMPMCECVAEAYGVVFDKKGCIDETKTVEGRCKLAKGKADEFNFCDECKRQDRVWPLAVCRQLSWSVLIFEQCICSQLVGKVCHGMMAEGRTGRVGKAGAGDGREGRVFVGKGPMGGPPNRCALLLFGHVTIRRAFVIVSKSGVFFPNDFGYAAGSRGERGS